MTEVTENPYFPFRRVEGNDRLRLVCTDFTFRLVVFWIVLLLILYLIVSYGPQPLTEWVSFFLLLGVLIMAFRPHEWDVEIPMPEEHKLSKHKQSQVTTTEKRSREVVCRTFVFWRREVRMNISRVYIHLKRVGTVPPVYHLELVVRGVRPITFTEGIYDVEMIRLLGKRIAKQLGLNYFDYQEVSSEHRVLEE